MRNLVVLIFSILCAINFVFADELYKVGDLIKIPLVTEAYLNPKCEKTFRYMQFDAPSITRNEESAQLVRFVSGLPCDYKPASKEDLQFSDDVKYADYIKAESDLIKNAQLLVNVKVINVTKERNVDIKGKKLFLDTYEFASWDESFLNKVMEFRKRIKMTGAPTQINSDGQKTINPFGELRWEDGLFSVISKLKQMGASSVEISISGFDKFSASPLSNSELENKIFAMYKKAANGRPKQAIDFFYWEDFTFTDGSQKKYFIKPIEIVAKGINIFGVLSQLTALFDGNADTTVVYPNNIFKLDSDHIFSPLLTNVSIISDAPNLKEKKQTIRRVLAEKYFQDEIKDAQKYQRDPLESVFSPVFGHKDRGIDGEVSDSLLLIVYYNNQIGELHEKYRKMTSNLEKKKTENKKDVGSGL